MDGIVELTSTIKSIIQCIHIYWNKLFRRLVHSDLQSTSARTFKFVDSLLVSVRHVNVNTVTKYPRGHVLINKIQLVVCWLRLILHLRKCFFIWWILYKSEPRKISSDETDSVLVKDVWFKNILTGRGVQQIQKIQFKLILVELRFESSLQINICF